MANYVLAYLFRRPLPEVVCYPCHFNGFVTQASEGNVRAYVFRPSFSCPAVPFNFDRCSERFFSNVVNRLCIEVVNDGYRQYFLAYDVQDLASVGREGVQGSDGNVFRVIRVARVSGYGGPLFAFPLFRFVRVLQVAYQRERFVRWVRVW